MDSQAQSTNAIKVEIAKTATGYQLLRGGEPYQILGAGLNDADLQVLASYGGNSIRTWSVNSGTQRLLDQAHALGMTVSLGIWIRPERHGFDYDDARAVAKQLASAQQSVLKYKDHPALLSWFIGNELNLNFTNSRVYNAVEQIAQMIHRLDPNHPVTTTLAGFDTRALAIINEKAPSLDFISFQLYAEVVDLPRFVVEYGFTAPYMITEWGAIGHWEVEKTSWGAPIEVSSSEKARHYAKSYAKAIANQGQQVIGNYVFFWGQKQERTPTWYGLFLASGERTESIDVMSHIWTGQWPNNRTPSVSPITLDAQLASDNIHLTPKQIYRATIKANDHEQDSLTYHWEIRKESNALQIGGDREDIPDLIENLISNAKLESISFKAPPQTGAYRLFVFVYDGNGNAGHANIPFFVN
ncbi:hypothetical protein [Glaciecola sp. SC05]|uniref:hypothetical protein n=1 Tax=Glaciecola sp. SC05 TaxID=1987355 RepID=UPI003527E07A